ncbi:MAG: prepilin-type N-terminal cleavage/methylation domain-containing protein [Nitrospirota bacterium]
MNNKKGFTLVELLVAMAVLLVAAAGFFSWATNILQYDLSMRKNNTAYTIALDIADRLQRMQDNALIQPRTGGVTKCVGFNDAPNSGGDLQTCSGAVLSGSAPASDSTGMTVYTNPWNGTTNTLYLYDKNSCEGLTWVDNLCRTNVNIAAAANTNIDHPNANTTAYDSINPIRTYNTTTYYAVWSVVYMPCTCDTKKRKIFVTVYWIDPEPNDATVAAVQTKIDNHTYTIKNVSLVVDKVIGTES